MPITMHLNVFTFDPMCQLRRLLSNVLPDYERRGTREGFEELLTVYLGEDWAGLAINELLNPFQIGCDYKGRKLAGNHSVKIPKMCLIFQNRNSNA